MQREQTLIPVDMDQEEVALRFQKYGLISAAVVDGSGRLVGMITVDDIVHIIQEEASEDITRLSGAGDGDINKPLFDTVKTRSEEHTSELQSIMRNSYAVLCLKKKNNTEQKEIIRKNTHIVLNTKCTNL